MTDLISYKQSIANETGQFGSEITDSVVKETEITRRESTEV